MNLKSILQGNPSVFNGYLKTLVIEDDFIFERKPLMTLNSVLTSIRFNLKNQMNKVKGNLRVKVSRFELCVADYTWFYTNMLFAFGFLFLFKFN